MGDVRLDTKDLMNEVSELDDMVGILGFHGRISGKNDTIVKNRPGSKSVG